MGEPEAKPTQQALAPVAREKAARAARLWGGMTLSLVAVLSALVIWHLVRRGRVIQSGLGPARPDSRLSLPPTDSQGSS